MNDGKNKELSKICTFRVNFTDETQAANHFKKLMVLVVLGTSRRDWTITESQKNHSLTLLVKIVIR